MQLYIGLASPSAPTVEYVHDFYEVKIGRKYDYFRNWAPRFLVSIVYNFFEAETEMVNFSCDYTSYLLAETAQQEVAVTILNLQLYK